MSEDRNNEKLINLKTKYKGKGLKEKEEKTDIDGTSLAISLSLGTMLGIIFDNLDIRQSGTVDVPRFVHSRRVECGEKEKEQRQ